MLTEDPSNSVKLESHDRLSDVQPIATVVDRFQTAGVMMEVQAGGSLSMVQPVPTGAHLSDRVFVKVEPDDSLSMTSSDPSDHIGLKVERDFSQVCMPDSSSMVGIKSEWDTSRIFKDFNIQ